MRELKAVLATAKTKEELDSMIEYAADYAIDRSEFLEIVALNVEQQLRIAEQDKRIAELEEQLQDPNGQL